MNNTRKKQSAPFTKDDLVAVSDNPEWTAEDFVKARPASEVLTPEFLDAVKRRQGQRGPQKKPTKQLVSLRLDRDVIERLKAHGAGWQSRLNDVLRKALDNS